jgi:hypothetical protein
MRRPTSIPLFVWGRGEEEGPAVEAQTGHRALTGQGRAALIAVF